jgi:hypothetical protein
VGAAFDYARIDGANFEEANLSGAVLSQASMLGTNFRRALLFGTNFSGGHIWQSNSSAEKGYALAVLTGLAVAPPSQDDLARLQSTATSLESLEGPLGKDAAARLAPLLEEQKRTAWDKTEDFKIWAALAAHSVKVADMEMLGRYLGDLACSNSATSFGIIRNHIADPGYESYGYFTPDPVMPPGLTYLDIDSIQGRYGSGTYELDQSFKSHEKPDIVAAFAKRVHQSDCSVAFTASNLRLLDQRLQELEKRALEPSNTQRPDYPP